MLQEQDRQKLDNIVKQMTTNKESQENIQFVVNDFKQKYSKKEIDKSVKGESLFEDIRLGLAKSEIGLVKGVGSLFGKLGAGIMAVPRSLGGEESFGEAYERGKRIGKKNVERIFGDRVFSEEALKREGAGQQIGGAVGDIATFLAPAGAITKGATAVSKVAGAGKTLSKTRGLLGRAGTEALGYGAVETARQGELNEEVATVGGIAGALPIVGAVAKPVISKIADTGGRILKSTAGVFSGKGTAVIDSILKNPVAALKGLRGETSLTSQAKDIQKGVKTLRSNAGKEYREAVDKLPVKFKKFKNGATQVISQEGKKTTITTKGILENLSKTLDDFKVTMDGGKLNTKYSPLDNIEAKRLDDVFDAINKWDDTTPEGLLMLTRKIKNFRTATQTSELNSIIDRTSKNILDYLSKKVPQVKDINKKYATSMDILDVMKQEFGAKGGISTAERIKVEKKISNIFSGEKGTGIEMLEKEIVGGKDIIGQEAGRLLSEGVSRSTASIGDLVRGLSQIVISPKMVGELTALTGITKTQAVKFIATLEKADPVTKGILLEWVSEQSQD